MRLAVISDIHGNLLALEAVLADIKTRGVDATFNLGDCVASPLWPRETFELLETLKLPTVRGNHDRWVLDRSYDDLPRSGRYAYDQLTPAQRQALGSLPATIEVSPEVLAVHGTPTDDRTYLVEETADGRLIPAKRELILSRLGEETRREVVLCGHSHTPAVRQVAQTCLIVNPGSVGCPLFADGAMSRTLEPRSPHARYAVLTRRNGRWGAELYALEYDWMAASRRAADNGRPEWAEALATGSVS